MYRNYGTDTDALKPKESFFSTLFRAISLLSLGDYE